MVQDQNMGFTSSAVNKLQCSENPETLNLQKYQKMGSIGPLWSFKTLKGPRTGLSVPAPLADAFQMENREGPAAEKRKNVLIRLDRESHAPALAVSCSSRLAQG